MEKDNTIYLRNIIDKAEEALGFCNNRTLEEFLENNMLQSAVVLKLIINWRRSSKNTKRNNFLYQPSLAIDCWVS